MSSSFHSRIDMNCIDVAAEHRSVVYVLRAVVAVVLAGRNSYLSVGARPSRSVVGMSSGATRHLAGCW